MVIFDQLSCFSPSWQPLLKITKRLPRLLTTKLSGVCFLLQVSILNNKAMIAIFVILGPLALPPKLNFEFLDVQFYLTLCGSNLTSHKICFHLMWEKISKNFG